MKVTVHTFSLADDGNIDLRWARERLIPSEMERAAAFKFDLHRDRYVRGRAMVREILGVADLPFELGPNQKPSVPGIEFNVSHSEDRAVVAVASEPVGIDVERFDREVNFRGLGERCFRESEQAWIARNPFPAEAFFWTWTAKEARMKLTGEGFSLEPMRIEVAFAQARPSEYLAPQFPKAYLTAIHLPRISAACCLATPIPDCEVELVVR